MYKLKIYPADHEWKAIDMKFHSFEEMSIVMQSILCNQDGDELLVAQVSYEPYKEPTCKLEVIDNYEVKESEEK